jgi:NADPH:quinone reductase-like Zn-dependent oxidoreductase
MPNNSTTYNYGALSLQPITVSSVDLIFKSKTITGWWLTSYLTDLELAGKLFAGAFANLATKTYKTEVCAKYPQEEFAAALEFYSKNASKGKVLIQNPNF